VEVDDTLGFLVGRWRLVRTIRDRLAGVDGVFEGTAEIGGASPSVPLLLASADHCEDGALTFGAHSGHAGRRLRYERAGGAVRALFADGRPFVELDLRPGVWRGVHTCGDDRYEMELRVESADAFLEQWQVQGPAKSYEASTSYRRLPTTAV